MFGGMSDGAGQEHLQFGIKTVRLLQWRADFTGKYCFSFKAHRDPAALTAYRVPERFYAGQKPPVPVYHIAGQKYQLLPF